MQRDNETWIADLHADGRQREEALGDLREILLRILARALSRWLPPTDPHFDAFIEDVAQETLLRVLDRLDTFKGHSKFTTWVYTIAVRIGLSELRLKKWKEVSLNALEESRDPEPMPYKRFAKKGTNPENTLTRKNALQLVMTVMQETLTPYQRSVMKAVIFEGAPMDVVAERMDTSRNALYKVMHDARVKIKQSLEEQGFPPETLLEGFDQ